MGEENTSESGKIRKIHLKRGQELTLIDRRQGRRFLLGRVNNIKDSSFEFDTLASSHVKRKISTVDLALGYQLIIESDEE